MWPSLSDLHLLMKKMLRQKMLKLKGNGKHQNPYDYNFPKLILHFMHDTPSTYKPNFCQNSNRFLLKKKKNLGLKRSETTAGEKKL